MLQEKTAVIYYFQLQVITKSILLGVLKLKNQNVGFGVCIFKAYPKLQTKLCNKHIDKKNKGALFIKHFIVFKIYEHISDGFFIAKIIFSVLFVYTVTAID